MLGNRLRILAAASLAGLAAGVASGAVARLAMRLVAILRDQPPEVSLGGTIGILIVFTAMAAALGISYALLTRAFRRGPAPGWWALAGVGLLAAVLSVTPLRQEVARGPQLIALFLPVGLVLGWLPAWLGRVLSSRLPECRSAFSAAGYGVVALPGLLLAVAMPLLIVFGILQTVGVIQVPAD